MFKFLITNSAQNCYNQSPQYSQQNTYPQQNYPQYPNGYQKKEKWSTVKKVSVGIGITFGVIIGFAVLCDCIDLKNKNDLEYQKKKTESLKKSFFWNKKGISPDICKEGDVCFDNGSREYICTKIIEFSSFQLMRIFEYNKVEYIAIKEDDEFVFLLKNVMLKK